MIQRWDLAAAGDAIAWPKPVHDRGLPRRLYRERKWQLRREVTRALVKTGLRQMNAHYSHNGDPAAARDVLGYWELKDTATARLDPRIVSQIDSKDGDWIVLDDYEVAASVKRALRTLARIWTPEFIDTASLAGRISMRPKTFTLEQYAGVRELPQRLAAEVMGCSVRTIKRLAAAWRATGGALVGAVRTRVERLTSHLKTRGQLTRAGAVTGPVRSCTLGPPAGDPDVPVQLFLGSGPPPGDNEP